MRLKSLTFEWLESPPRPLTRVHSPCKYAPGLIDSCQCVPQGLCHRMGGTYCGTETPHEGRRRVGSHGRLPKTPSPAHAVLNHSPRGLWFRVVYALRGPLPYVYRPPCAGWGKSCGKWRPSSGADLRPQVCHSPQTHHTRLRACHLVASRHAMAALSSGGAPFSPRTLLPFPNRHRLNAPKLPRLLPAPRHPRIAPRTPLVTRPHVTRAGGGGCLGVAPPPPLERGGEGGQLQTASVCVLPALATILSPPCFTPPARPPNAALPPRIARPFLKPAHPARLLPLPRDKPHTHTTCGAFP